MPSHRPSTDQSQEYAWEVATLFPVQGRWSEEAYLSVTDHTNRVIELVNGRLEFLTMPTEWHQILLKFLFRTLDSFVEDRQLGTVHFVGIRIRINEKTTREPDVVFLCKENYHLRHPRVWQGADLAIEIVSDDPKDRRRDYEEKRDDYAEAGIPECWIVDYEKRVVIVHKLVDGKYQIHGQFQPGTQATSLVVKGYSVDVAALFAAADEIRDEIS